MKVIAQSCQSFEIKPPAISVQRKPGGSLNRTGQKLD